MDDSRHGTPDHLVPFGFGGMALALMLSDEVKDPDFAGQKEASARTGKWPHWCCQSA